MGIVGRRRGGVTGGGGDTGGWDRLGEAHGRWLRWVHGGPTLKGSVLLLLVVVVVVAGLSVVAAHFVFRGSEDKV